MAGRKRSLLDWIAANPVQALVGVVIDAFVLYALLAYSGPDEAY